MGLGAGGVKGALGSGVWAGVGGGEEEEHEGEAEALGGSAEGGAVVEPAAGEAELGGTEFEDEARSGAWMEDGLLRMVVSAAGGEGRGEQ